MVNWMPSQLSSSRFWPCRLDHAATELVNLNVWYMVICIKHSRVSSSSIPTWCCSTPIRMPRAVCPTPYALGQNLSHGTDGDDFTPWSWTGLQEN